jgi:Calreticulin family
MHVVHSPPACPPHVALPTTLARQLQDPDAKKPDDWDDRAKIDDPESVKPEGYDDIPKKITDADAKKPEDWDDEDDGAWEPPQARRCCPMLVGSMLRCSVIVA